MMHTTCAAMYFSLKKEKQKLYAVHWKPQNGSCQLKGYIFIILKAMWIGNPRELENYLAMLLSFLKDFTTNSYRRCCRKGSFKV